MMKKIVVLTLLFSPLLASASLRHDTDKIAKTVFGPTGTDLSLVSCQFMEDLLYQLKTTTPYEQQCACKKTATILNKEIEKREDTLEKTSDLLTKQRIDYNLSILTIQKEHYERVARLLNQDMRWQEKVIGWIKNAVATIQALLMKPFKTYLPPIKTLTKNLVRYADIERNEIFTNHKKTLMLLACQNMYSIPLTIRFWDYPRYRHRLLNGVKKFQSTVHPQAGALVDAAADTALAAADAAAGTAGNLVEGSGEAVIDAENALATETTAFEAALPTAEGVTAEALAAATVSNAMTAGIAQALASATEDLASASAAEATFSAADESIQSYLTELAQQQSAAASASFISTTATTEDVAADLAARQAGAQAGQASSLATEGASAAATGEQGLTDLADDEAAAGSEEAAEQTRWTRFKAWLAKKFSLESLKKLQESMTHMLEQVEVAMGSQMVTAWQNTADANEYAALSTQRTNMITTLNQYLSSLTLQEQNAMGLINTHFSSNIAAIAQQMCLQVTSTGSVVIQGLLPSLFAIEKSFITQSLISATVKQIFLQNSLQEDQLFYNAPMAAQKIVSSFQPYTSNGLPTTWYNPYRSGNWEFCSSDYSGTTQGPVTSFVQYNAQECTTTANPTGDPTIAMQNSIFTEYIPSAQYNPQNVESYTISVECTLLSEPCNPFMMGVIFNKARWISGVLDLQHQQRLFCLYSIPGQKPGTYNVGFAETFYQNQTDAAQDQLSDQGTPGINAIWPAYQILTPTINALAKQSNITPVPNPLATIPALPIGTPYVFTIQTEPTQVTLTISTKEGAILYPANGQTTSSSPTSSGANQIQKLNALIFLYHNIGFMAPGCSVQFSIKEPKALCYSQSQIQAVQTVIHEGGSPA